MAIKHAAEITAPIRGSALSVIVQIAAIMLPWPIRRVVLRVLLGFDLAPSCRIGFSLVLAQRVALGARSRIGHLTFVRGLAQLQMDADAVVGNLNWITAYDGSVHFAHQLRRDPSLFLGPAAAITNRHLIDCTDAIRIGEGAIVAGFRSQLLTHQVDMATALQISRPVTIGKCCFVGTGVMILPGSQLPDYCVVGAGSTLRGVMSGSFQIFSGVPAVPVANVDPNGCFFTRTKGCYQLSNGP